MKTDILIIGGGSVTQNFCFCLASKKNDVELNVVILSRGHEKNEALISLYNAISKTQQGNVNFSGESISWDNLSEIQDKIIHYNPTLIFHTASLQSPWEFLETHASNVKWKSFIEVAGNGFVVPLSVALVKQVATIVKQNLPNTILVNACFPDNVNPILKYLNLPITCGIGNISMYTSILSSLVGPKKIKSIGHLYHFFKILGKQHGSIEGPKVWIDDKEITNVEVELKNSFYQLRNINSLGKFINQLVGSTAVEAILALLGNKMISTHVPGPNGLSGGYPVLIGNGQVQIDLPANCSEQEAAEVNDQGAYDMGCATIDENGFIKFSDTSTNFVKQYSFTFAEGFNIEDLDKVCEEMLVLKDTVNNS